MPFNILVQHIQLWYNYSLHGHNCTMIMYCIMPFNILVQHIQLWYNYSMHGHQYSCTTHSTMV